MRLTPLLPLTAVSEQELPGRAASWARRLEESTELKPEVQQSLLGLLGAFLSHRLPKLGLQRIEQLLGGKKMEDTPLGQMLIEVGIEKGIEKGIERGRTAEAQRLLEKLARRRFGDVPAWLSKWALAQSHPESIEQAMDQILDVSDEATLRKLLYVVPVIPAS